MNKKILLIYFFSSSIMAAIPFNIPPGKWQCLAFDAKKYSYPGIGNNMKKAMMAASHLCKRSSKQRLTCETAQSFCEQGPLSLIDDRCVVTDQTGHSWNTTGKNSCKVAMKLCTQWQFLHGKTSQCSVKHR